MTTDELKRLVKAMNEDEAFAQACGQALKRILAWLEPGAGKRAYQREYMRQRREATRKPAPKARPSQEFNPERGW